MVSSTIDSPLSARGGQEWMLWFGRASHHLPDLERAFQFLEISCELLGSSEDAVVRARPKKLKQAINRFIGQARCPSSQSCEKIAVRTLVLAGWLQSESSRPTADPLLLADLGAHGLQKLLGICEGADDKHGVLMKAVREYARDWLNRVASALQNPVERAHLVYPVAMLDQAGLVEPAWWWKQLSTCDRVTLLGLMELEINQMNEMQPTSHVGWRSFDKRWRRLRLRALLEHLEEKRMLAELLRKSAVDDFEAVMAVRLLRECGRFRDAVVQAEQWLRALPRSPVLAEALYELYVEDGWNEEALALSVTHYSYDPNPAWISRLKQLGTPAALRQAEIWSSQGLS